MLGGKLMNTAIEIPGCGYSNFQAGFEEDYCKTFYLT